MSNPRIEEVSDSDPEIDDPEEFAPGEYMRRASESNEFTKVDSSIQERLSKGFTQLSPDALAEQQAKFRAQQAAQAQSSSSDASRPPQPQQQMQMGPTPEQLAAQVRHRKEIKQYNTIYPIYFNAARSRRDGRRVGKELACENPLAFQIYKAVRMIVSPSTRVDIEPDKTHPKDWSNPGRVKVQLYSKDGHGKLDPKIENPQHLYNLVAQWLKNNPTTKETPLELRLPGLQVPEKFLDTPVALLRGRKMQEILPLHSDAVSGGGVSDNFFKDAIEELKAGGQQGLQGPGGMDMGAMAQMMENMGKLGGTGGQTAPKKPKKMVIRA